MSPEIYTITYAMLVKAQRVNELSKMLLHNECVCGHIAYHHNCETWRDVNRLEEQYRFKHCGKCKCSMFKRDNLKYLEAKASERSSL